MGNYLKQEEATATTICTFHMKIIYIVVMMDVFFLHGLECYYMLSNVLNQIPIYNENDRDLVKVIFSGSNRTGE